MKNFNIAVVGAKGKMGSVICNTLKADYNVVAITSKECLCDFDNIDLVIDFASSVSSVVSARFCKKHQIPLIVGATGQTEADLKEIYSVSKVAPVLKAGNFSVGVVLLKKMLKILLKCKNYDISIIEKHHKLKKDMPSGTALEFQELIEKSTKTKVPILSERGGLEIGTHQIDLYFGGELISLEHKSFSRDCFAYGAKLATDYMLSVKKPGVYNFEQIIETILK